MKTKRTEADLSSEAQDFAKNHPYDMEGSLALARKLEDEAKSMKEYPTMAMRTVNRLLLKRFENAKGKSK